MYDRRVYLGECSEVGPKQGRTTLTPNANAARPLGVEPLTLETLARQILGDERIARPLAIQRLLRVAVEDWCYFGLEQYGESVRRRSTWNPSCALRICTWTIGTCRQCPRTTSLC